MDGTDWPRAKIVEAIYARGLSLRGLGERLGIGERAIAYALNPAKRWPRVQKKVADFLGVEPHEIWPSRYRSPGIPVGRPHISHIITGHIPHRPRSNAKPS